MPYCTSIYILWGKLETKQKTFWLKLGEAIGIKWIFTVESSSCQYLLWPSYLRPRLQHTNQKVNLSNLYFRTFQTEYFMSYSTMCNATELNVQSHQMSHQTSWFIAYLLANGSLSWHKEGAIRKPVSLIFEILRGLCLCLPVWSLFPLIYWCITTLLATSSGMMGNHCLGSAHRLHTERLICSLKVT